MPQKPVHQIRLGRIKATIWRNDTERGPRRARSPRHNVQIVRLYRDGEQWKQTHSFGRDDLPLVSKVADLAQGWIYLAGNPKETDKLEERYREQQAQRQQNAGG